MDEPTDPDAPRRPRPDQGLAARVVGGAVWTGDDGSRFCSPPRTSAALSATVRHLCRRSSTSCGRLPIASVGAYYWSRSVIDQFVPGVVAWSSVPIQHISR